MTETQTPELPLMDWFELTERERLEQTAKDEEWYVPVVQCISADRLPLVLCFVGAGGRIEPKNALIHASKILMAATEAEYLLVSMDAHGTSLPKNPETGEDWGAHEMQQLCEKGYCASGEIYDQLMLMIVRRSDGKMWMRGLKYHAHKGEMQWLVEDDGKSISDLNEWDDADGGVKLGGYVPDALREAATAKTIIEHMAEQMGIDAKQAEDLFGLDTRRRILHQVLAGVGTLMRQAREIEMPSAWMCAIPAYEEEEAEIIAESMARYGASVHGEDEMRAEFDQPE